MAWYEKITGSLDDKRRFREYRARVAALPPAHRHAVQALERYVLGLGPTGDSARMLDMLNDLADLFEQSAADGTGVRAVVGEDPAAFAEEFMANYGDSSWIGTERARLARAIEDAENGGAS